MRLITVLLISVVSLFAEPSVEDSEAIYSLLSQQLRLFHRPFTVLELGAGNGSISKKLAADFPDSVFVMVEKNLGPNNKKADILLESLQQDGVDTNILLLNKNFTVAELKTLSHVEHFDVVLALDFLPSIYLPKTYTPFDLLSSLIHLGDHVYTTVSQSCKIWIKLIGLSEHLIESHPLTNPESLIYQFNRSDPTLLTPHYYAPDSTTHELINTTETSILTVQKPNPPFRMGIQKPPGISLITFLALHGVWPTLESIKPKLKTLSFPLYPEQIILKGKELYVLPRFIASPLSTQKSFDATLKLLECRTHQEFEAKLSGGL